MGGLGGHCTEQDAAAETKPLLEELSPAAAEQVLWGSSPADDASTTDASSRGAPRKPAPLGDDEDESSTLGSSNGAGECLHELPHLYSQDAVVHGDSTQKILLLSSKKALLCSKTHEETKLVSAFLEDRRSVSPTPLLHRRRYPSKKAEKKLAELHEAANSKQPTKILLQPFNFFIATVYLFSITVFVFLSLQRNLYYGKAPGLYQDWVEYVKKVYEEGGVQGAAFYEWNNAGYTASYLRERSSPSFDPPFRAEATKVGS